MKKALLLTVLATITATAFAQWSEAFKPASKEIFRDMDFFKSDIGIIVGINYDLNVMVMYRSTDKGDSWTKLTNGSAVADLESVSCPTQLIGYGTGGGVILKTVNAGLNWTNVPYTTDKGPNEPLSYIRFTDEQNGIAAVDGFNRILRTSDGGKTWKTIYGHSSKPTYSTRAFYTPNNKDIFGINDNSTSNRWFIHSADSGATWDSVNITSITNNQYLSNIFFRDNQHGYIAMPLGRILKTQDAGATWVDQLVDSVYEENLNGVYFSDAMNGYATGDLEATFITRDGGVTWKDAYVDIGRFFVYDILRMYFFSNTHAVAYSQGGIVDRILSNKNLQLTTGLKEELGSVPIVYPNPVQSQLTIQLRDAEKINQVVLFDINGRPCVSLRSLNTGSVTLDTENISNGIYFLHITNDRQEISVRKIVKY